MKGPVLRLAWGLDVTCSLCHAGSPSIMRDGDVLVHIPDEIVCADSPCIPIDAKKVAKKVEPNAI